MTETVAEKGQWAKGNESMPEAGEPTASEATRARDARARDEEIVTDGGDIPPVEAAAEGLEGLLDLWIDEAKATLERLWRWMSGDRSVLREHPADLVALVEYWWRAPMAGSSGFLRFLQRLDAALFAAPGVAFFTAARWLWERPLRRTCFFLLALIVWRFS